MTIASSPAFPKARPTAPLLATIVALAISGIPSTRAANAAWNTDAASGNFNTAQWTSGTTTPAAGGTYTVLSGDALYFGTQTTGATSLTNDLTGASFAGLTFNSGASAYTIGGNSFTLTGNITNSGTNTQTINTAMTMSAARTFSATSGQLVLGGNITGSPAGNWTLTPTNKITLAGTNSLTFSGNFFGLNVNAGAGGVDITGSTTLNGASGNTQSGYLNVAGTTTVAIKSGGSLTINGTTNVSTPTSIIGQNTAGTSTLSIESGGTLTYGGNVGVALGNNIATAIGVLEVSGNATVTSGSATATDARSFIMVGKDIATGTINLNTGGVLTTGRNFVRDGSGTADASGTANFNFKGGTLKAQANQADWINSSTKNTNQLAFTSVTTSSTASTIDANGFTVGINNAITGTGGFHIIDSSATTGIVHFGGASYAYTGATSVDSGTLNTNAASVTFSGSLAVAGGALTLNGTSAGAISVAGFTMSSGTWTVSLNDTVSVTGNMNITGGTLNVAAFSGSENSYTSGYSLFTSISGTGAVSGLSITGYDTTNYTASLSNAGVLTFSAIPEPSTYAALAGALTLGAAIIRRRSTAKSV